MSCFELTVHFFVLFPLLFFPPPACLDCLAPHLFIEFVNYLIKKSGRKNKKKRERDEMARHHFLPRQMFAYENLNVFFFYYYFGGGED